MTNFRSQPHGQMRVSSRARSQAGFASIEAVMIMALFITLIAFTMGMFGVVHTSILNSIATRTYMFEMLRHRSNFVYFRDRAGGGNIASYQEQGFRYNTVISEDAIANLNRYPAGREFPATTRPIAIAIGADVSGESQQNHNSTIFSDGTLRYSNQSKRATTTQASPVWIRTQYGICLNSTCGE